jgi:hypothetical protein
MKKQQVYRFGWIIATLVFLLTSTGCGAIPATPAAPAATSAPATAAPASASPAAAATTPPTIPASGIDALYHDNFTDPATGWPEDKFDNYFIGYHEPEYYHIEITSPNYKTTVFEPEKKKFDSFTTELLVLTNSKKTAATGDFRYGLAFRRTGDQYYAFTISPRTKKWYLLKSSPNALTVLTEGTDNNIHELDTNDSLRVDAQGSDFYLHINDKIVGQVTDPDYTTGEIGFYVETFDATNAHIHFDELTIRNFEAPQPEGSTATVRYKDDFTDPTTGWAEKKFDNYFIGYHEPEYYHIEITSPNYKTTVFEPKKESFTDFTVELQVLTNSKKTSPTGDFRYGIAYRRSGDNFYAFTISPRTKKWYVLKSSPNALTVLTEGTANNIHNLDTDDALRVDVQGSNFLFHINDELVGQVTDADYTAGEIGFYVETFDATNAHIHFDTLTIRDFEVSLVCDSGNNTIYLRSGPSTKFATIGNTSSGQKIIPVGISPDKNWIKVKVEGNDNQGWIFYSPGLVSCNASVKLLPVINP